MTSINYSTKPEFKRKRNRVKKLSFGVGINDATYPVNQKLNGNTILCPFFIKWKNMITRCYSVEFHKRQPAYKACSVTKEWLSFMSFRSWMKKQDWRGKELDKDILYLNNKIYSPETCLFIDHNINMLLNSRTSLRGDNPQGVNFDKKSMKFRAQITRFGKKKTLGLFNTAKEAELIYKKEKAEYIRNVAFSQSSYKIIIGLLRHAKKYEKEHLTN